MKVKRSPELEQLAEEAHRREIAGDDAWFADRIADGEVMTVGSAMEEVFRGRDAVLALSTERMREELEQAGLQYGADVPREVEAYETGDTGWIVTTTSFVLTDGSTIPTRSIALLAREDGDWKWLLGATHVVVANELLTSDSPLVSGRLAATT
jgi:hypothetical protein